MPSKRTEIDLVANNELNASLDLIILTLVLLNEVLIISRITALYRLEVLQSNLLNLLFNSCTVLVSNISVLGQRRERFGLVHL